MSSCDDAADYGGRHRDGVVCTDRFLAPVPWDDLRVPRAASADFSCGGRAAGVPFAAMANLFLRMTQGPTVY